MRWALATTLALAATLGCSGAPEAAPTQDRVDRTIESIIGGKASGADRDAVVVLDRILDAPYAPPPIARESPVAPPTTTTHGGCGIAGAPLGGDNDAFSQAVGVTVLLAGAIRVLRRVFRHARRSLD
jgi:hypothetical protein